MLVEPGMKEERVQAWRWRGWGCRRSDTHVWTRMTGRDRLRRRSGWSAVGIGQADQRADVEAPFRPWRRRRSGGCQCFAVACRCCAAWKEWKYRFEIRFSYCQVAQKVNINSFCGPLKASFSLIVALLRDKNCIRTQIIRVEGEHSGHYGMQV